MDANGQKVWGKEPQINMLNPIIGGNCLHIELITAKGSVEE
jgi:hypothetical protein